MLIDLSILFTPEELARPPQQKRSREKQQAIFEAAATLFGQKGYHGTNTNEIATLAGVSIGTLYFQFSDKRQILLTLLAQQISGYADLLGEIDTAALQKSPFNYLSHPLQLAYPYNATFYNISGAIRQLIIIDEPFRQRFSTLYEAIFGRVFQIIQAGQTAGMTHPHLDPNSTSFMVTNLIFNFYALLPNPTTVSEKSYWQHHKIACQMAFRAIFREEFCHPHK